MRVDFPSILPTTVVFIGAFVLIASAAPSGAAGLAASLPSAARLAQPAQAHCRKAIVLRPVLTLRPGLDAHDFAAPVASNAASPELKVCGVTPATLARSEPGAEL